MYNVIVCEVVHGSVRDSKEYTLDFIPFVGMHVQFDFLRTVAKVTKVVYLHDEKSFDVYCEY